MSPVASLIHALDERSIAREVALSHDEARMRYRLHSNTVRDFDEALDVANGTEFGLTGGVHSGDEARLERAKRDFHVGNLYLNRKITGALVGIQPFGGFNMSGSNAKAGGPDYLRLFMEMKSVSEKNS